MQQFILLLMNLLQMEHGLLPTRILREDKAEYIQALIDAREREDVELFLDYMAGLQCRQLEADIDGFIRSMER